MPTVARTARVDYDACAGFLPARSTNPAETDDWIQTVEERPDVVLLMAEFWLYAVRRSDLRALVAAFLASVRDNFTATIDELTSLDGTDRDTAASALQALAYGYAMQRTADPDAVSGDQFTRAVQWMIRGAAR